MSEITLQIPTADVGWFEQMVRTMGWVFTRKDAPASDNVDNRQVITPSMRRRINKARKEYAEGKTIRCSTQQEMQQFFDRL